MKPTKEQIDILAREMCFYSVNDLGCIANCDECFGYYWRKYKLPAKRVIEKWEKIRGEK